MTSRLPRKAARGGGCIQAAALNHWGWLEMPQQCRDWSSPFVQHPGQDHCAGLTVPRDESGILHGWDRNEAVCALTLILHPLQHAAATLAITGVHPQL